MAEYNNRENLVELLTGCSLDTEEDVVYVADKLIAADVAPVVRCKECKYHNKPPCPMRLSLNWTKDNDFCSYGERRESE